MSCVDEGEVIPICRHSVEATQQELSVGQHARLFLVLDSKKNA
jgi:hypothetical protein